MHTEFCNYIRGGFQVTERSLQLLFTLGVESRFREDRSADVLPDHGLTIKGCCLNKFEGEFLCYEAPARKSRAQKLVF